MSEPSSLLSAPTGLLDVPNELLEAIVLDSAGDYFQDPLLFVSQRTSILASCRRLRGLAINYHRLWCCYTLSPNVSLSELACISERWGASPLNLRLSFLGEGDACPAADEGCASLDHILDFFVVHSPRCVDLHVTIDSFVEVASILNALEASDQSALLALTVVWRETHLAFSPSVFHVMDVPFHGEDMQALSTLRLYDIPFNWLHLSSFSTLTVLVLHFRYADFAPDIAQLAAVLRSNPLLCKLSLRLHIARHYSRPGYVAPVVLSRLHTVDVDWLDSHERVREFASLLHLPNLSDLSYFFSRVDDVDVFCSLVRNSPAVLASSLCGRIPSSESATRVLRAIPRVSDLDVSDVSSLVFSTVLTEDARTSQSLCPRLSTLTVAGFRAQDLRTIVEARLFKGCAIKVLNCSRIHTCTFGSRHFSEYRSALLYLIRSVASFNVRSLCIGGEWTRSTEWMFH
ncbi:hypothetical protein C8R47DRAFT_1200360 [Mycena vitilis]|nr:hypothetical protein C8R47DRAFT_1200360 [Mycena vitilis]